MILLIASFQTINAVAPDPKFLFLIALYVADAATINPNGIKMLFANGVNTLFINGQQAVINGLRKWRNPPFRQVIFLVISFNKIALFFHNIFYFIVC